MQSEDTTDSGGDGTIELDVRAVGSGTKDVVDGGTTSADAIYADVEASDALDVSEVEEDTVQAGSDTSGPTDAEADAEDSWLPDSDSNDAVDGDAFEGDVNEELDSGVEDAGVEADVEQEVACDPPLQISPALVYLEPYELILFQASGGTGDYRFSFSNGEGSQGDSQTGGIVNSITGAYLAGATVGASDFVLLTDEGCLGGVEAQVIVAEPLNIEPVSVACEPETSFKFSVSGGSGFFSFSGVQFDSGGSVSPDGDYVAGPETGLDTVMVEDTATGESVLAAVTVSDSAPITAQPPRLAMPVGSAVGVVVEGGSGAFEVVVDDVPELSWDGDHVFGEAAGTVSVSVVDQYTGATTEVGITVMESLGYSIERSGENQVSGDLLSGVDINGDGLDDFVVAAWDIGFGGWRSGAVHVYAGTEEGGFTISRTFEGFERELEYGRSIAMGDLNGDGHVDLAIGAPRADFGFTDNGAVQVFYGIEEGFFEEYPSEVLVGPEGSARLGSSIAICDVNGDGVMDLASGLRHMEEPGNSSVASNQGALHVWLGYPDGLLEEPDVIRYGMYPGADGTWKQDQSMELGWSLAAGDINGDGYCDLAVGAIEYSPEALNTNDHGLVAIYTGVGPDDLTLGGLNEYPARVIEGSGPGSNGGHFGRFLDLADLDSDGLDDLIVGQPTCKDPTNVAVTAVGAVHVYLSSGWEESGSLPSLENEGDADWSMYGGSGDRMGYFVRGVDLTGEGEYALLASEVNGEISGGTGNTGVVYLFEWNPTGEGSLFEVSESFPGQKGSDYFGLAVGVVEDKNADGLRDLAVFSSRDDSIEYDAGQVFLQYRGEDAQKQPLGFPGLASGQHFGSSVDIVSDMTGDGVEDILVGEKFHCLEGHGIKVGRVSLYAGTNDGTTPQLHLPMNEFPGFSLSTLSGSFDQLGVDVSGAGDFDNDGYQDFAAAATAGEHPTNINSTHFVEVGDCGASVSSAGAVYVFSGASAAEGQIAPIAMGFGFYNDNVTTVSGGGDINGDGFDDVVFGSPAADGSAANSGQIHVMYGRPAEPDGRVVMDCDSKTIDSYEGPESDTRFGQRVRFVGDWNGDGCDDFIVSSYLGNQGLNNQGLIQVVYGWGGPGCPSEPLHTNLGSLFANSQAGFGLDVGGDFDGDGIVDVAVGGFNSTVGGTQVGSAWVIPGSYLQSLPVEPLLSFSIPSEVHPFVSPSAQGTFRIDGTTFGGRFGRSVAFVPGIGAEGRAALAVSSPLGASDDVLLSGEVTIYQANPEAPFTGFAPEPIARISGDQVFSNSLFGEVIAGGSMGGVPTLVIGAQYGTIPELSDTSRETGAVYVVPFPVED